MDHRHPGDAVRAELIRIRKSRKITQQVLGIRMGRTQTAVNLMERAERREIRISTLARWAECLGLQLEIRLVDPGELPGSGCDSSRP